MGAFSPSDTMKEAEGFPRQMGAWSFEQFRQWLDSAAKSGANADQMRSAVTTWLQGQGMESPTPDQIRQVGDQIMPGLGSALATRQGNLDQIQSSFNQLTPGSQTAQQIRDQLTGMAGDIVRTGDMNQNEINDWYSGGIGRTEGTNADIMASLRHTYDQAQGGVNDTFGTLRGRNDATTGNLLDSLGRTYNNSRDLSSGATRNLLSGADTAFAGNAAARNSVYPRLQQTTDQTIGGLSQDARDTFGGLRNEQTAGYGELNDLTGNTYGDLIPKGQQSFDESMAETEMLRPGGTAQEARVARSFAPVIGNAKQRLRSSGLRENDAQSISNLAEVEAQRAAAMDDAAAQSTQGYIDRRSGIRQAKQSDLERLAENRLGTTINLKQGQMAGSERLQTAMRSALENLGLTRLMNNQNLDLSKLSEDQRAAIDQQLMRQGLTLQDVQQQIGLNSSENQRSADLAQAGLNRDIGLGTGQQDRSTALELGQHHDYATQLQGQLRDLNALSAGKSQASIANNDAQYGRTQDWRQQGIATDQLERAMQQQDWNTAANILREQSGEQLTALQLRDLAYGRGDQNLKDAYTRALGSMDRQGAIATQNKADQFRGADTARGFGSDASKNYNTAYGYEAANNGWGWGLLAGALGASGRLPGNPNTPGTVPGSSGGGGGGTTIGIGLPNINIGGGGGGGPLFTGGGDGGYGGGGPFFRPWFPGDTFDQDYGPGFGYNFSNADQAAATQPDAPQTADQRAPSVPPQYQVSTPADDQKKAESQYSQQYTAPVDKSVLNYQPQPQTQQPAVPQNFQQMYGALTKPKQKNPYEWGGY